MNPRILLVDDDPMVCKALGTSLSRAGFDVTTAEDGLPAIEMSERHEFDVVIADFNMPRLGGVAVVRHYKQKFGRAVVCVVLSGDDDEVTHAACYLAGADDVIAKPVSPSELRRRIAISMLSARRTNAA